MKFLAMQTSPADISAFEVFEFDFSKPISLCWPKCEQAQHRLHIL